MTNLSDQQPLDERQPVISALGSTIRTSQLLIEALERLYRDRPDATQWLDELRRENASMRLALLQFSSNV